MPCGNHKNWMRGGRSEGGQGREKEGEDWGMRTLRRREETTTWGEVKGKEKQKSNKGETQRSLGGCRDDRVEKFCGGADNEAEKRQTVSFRE